MQTDSKSRQWPYYLLAIFNLLGLGTLFGSAALIMVSGMLSMVKPITGTEVDPTNNFLLACALVFCGLLLLPATYYSLRRLTGRVILPAAVRPVKFWQVAVLFAAWVATLFLGSLLSSSLGMGWLAALPFYLPGIALPVLGLAWIGLGGLPLGSRQRPWSALGIGMFGSTTLAALGEFLIYLVLIFLGTFALIMQPNWQAIAERLSTQISNDATDLDTILSLLSPYLTNPLVIALVLLVFALFVPLIEEAVKPVAVWLMGRRLRTPAEGFALGVLSGAGFALLEGFMAAASADSTLGLLLAGRAAGSLMHILTAGLMGWAIASLWQERRFGRLAGTYLLCVLIHGLWNGATVAVSLASIRLASPGMSQDVLSGLASLAGLGVMGLLISLLLIALPLINHRLRPAPSLPDAEAAQNVV